MSRSKPIRYLKREEINTTKWDECVADATNGLIYGYSFYLDHMATNWDALVLNDYEAVMPLPWRRKWGISYLYQPSLTAQLGVFGQKITEPILELFLQSIPKKFRHWDFSLNHENLGPVRGFTLYNRTNLVLPLNKPYNGMCSQYNENVRRNLKKSINSGCTIQHNVPLAEILALTRFQKEQLSKQDSKHFEKLFVRLKENGMAKTYGVVSTSGKLLSAAALLFSHQRAYYILAGNHPDGRTVGASHALVDTFINDHAEQNLRLDFEGSDIASIALFYQSFGAQVEQYAAIRRGLNLLFKLKKRIS